MSLGEFLSIQARLAAKAKRQPVAQDGVEHEADLHQQILDWCRRNGWLALHGSMAHKTKRTLGECDFCCLLPHGRVLFIECKSKTGKLTPEQLALKHWMFSLGHHLHVVRSFAAFLQICIGPQESTMPTCPENGSESSPSLSGGQTSTKNEDGSASATAEGS